MKIKHKSALYRAIIFGVLFILSFETVLFVYASFNEQTRINNLYPKYESIQSQIESVFQNTFTISDGYLSYISSNLDSSREETETFLGYILSYEDNYIKNIAIIEDTTIKYNYPYEENQSSIGVDLATIETQRDDILTVKNELESLFIGPVDLVQGGRAFILRIPILNTSETYWGQLAVVIDLDLFTQALIDEADNNEISFEIYDQASEDVILAYGLDVSNQESISNEYTNKYFTWTITISDASESSSLLLFSVLRLIGYGGILLICYFIYKDKVLNKKITYNSNHDSLTDLYNRAKFIKDYEDGKFNGMLIAFLDVNKFKLLNDTLGHYFGDWCLIKISNKLKTLSNFRIYRISGDEFMLVSITPMTIDDFKKALSSNKFTFYSKEYKQNVDIEIAIGILEKINPSIRLETMFMYLDYAMYDAKKENKSMTIVDDDLMTQYDENKVLEQHIIQDIKENRLIPYYQPIINLETKQIDGFEVLSKWYYQGEMHSAESFIDIVKKIKYIDLVDRNLFNKLQEEYINLIEECQTIKTINFSINLSFEILKIFERNNERFDHLVQNRKIPKDKLIFEISEDMNLSLISLDTLKYIQSKGYAISIDDFGAGVSKLSDVLTGEIKIIKTDKSLLPKKTSDQKKRSSFKTIINAITASDTEICVEGIETMDHLHLTIQSGCKLGQGFLFGKPMPKDELIHYVNNFNYENFLKKK